MPRYSTYLLVLGFIGLGFLTGCTENATEPLPDPTASFTWSGQTLAPATISFQNRSENADEFYWSFGDGTTSAEKDPVHIYSTPQIYFVNLIATQSSTGASRGHSQYVAITGNPPEVDFSWSGDTIAPATIYFQNLTRNADTYEWDFGDRTTSNVESPVHIFHSTGTFYVSLTATNTSAQLTESTTKTIVIVYRDPVADFDWAGETIVNTYITFKNRSSGASEISWNFGNGWETKPDSFRYIFASPGNYPVSLATFNPMTTKSDTITKTLPISLPEVALVRIGVLQIPFADSLGNPWDLDGGPDLIILMYNQNGGAVLGGGDVIMDLRQDQLPFDLTPAMGGVYLARSGSYRIDFHDLEMTVAPYGRLIGQVFFCVDSLKLSQGYRGVYSAGHDSLRLELGFEWRE